MSCRRITAWVYSRVSIFTSRGARSNMLTPFHPFSWKWEESALQFYDLIPLGKISVAPGMSSALGVEHRKKNCSVFSPSAFPRLSFLCCRYTKTPTHINICLHTKIFVCGRQPPPKSLPSAYKNKTAQSLCCTTCHLASLSAALFLTPLAALCFLDWTVHCAQSESAHRREKGGGRLLGQELGAVSYRVKLRLCDEWPVMREWWLKTWNNFSWGLCVENML